MDKGSINRYCRERKTNRNYKQTRAKQEPFRWTFQVQGKIAWQAWFWSPHPLSTQFPWSPVQWHLSPSFFDCLPDEFFWSPKHAHLWAGQEEGLVKQTSAHIGESVGKYHCFSSPRWGGLEHGLHPFPRVSLRTEPHASSRVFWTLTHLVLASFSVLPCLPMPPSHWGSWEYLPHSKLAPKSLTEGLLLGGNQTKEDTLFHENIQVTTKDLD